jgi:carboxylesterase type B
VTTGRKQWLLVALALIVLPANSNAAAALARSGDPSGKGLPSWPAFTSTNSRVVSFGDPIKVADVANISSPTLLDAV